MKQLTTRIVLSIALLAIGATAQAANLVANPSFENNQASFTAFPGYISVNTTINDWTGSATNNTGINGNAGSGYPFADNGTIPDGVAVGFVQSNGSASTLSQTIAGLSIGQFYQIKARVNARNGGAPNVQVSMGGTPLLTNQNLNAVGGGNPYRYVTLYRQAAATSEALEFRNSTGGDTTLVVDQVSVDPVFTTGWSASAWTNNATSGVDAANPYQYTHAYNFGTTASPVINGVTFQGVAGGNPSVLDKFTVTGTPSQFTGFGNLVTDPGSNLMASDFIYGGNPGAITIQGLVPGVQYVSTFYGVSFGGGGGRAADFSVNGDRITVDENALASGNGVKLQYTYTADATSKTFNVQPYDGATTIHVHGFANEDQSITGLFNTGTDGSRVSLADDAIDPHWTILSGPISGNAIVATSAGGFPIGPWIGDNSTSAWITPATNTEGPPGDYTYRTTFSLAGASNQLVQLSGLVSTDNSLVSILLNGVPVTAPGATDFLAFYPFNFMGMANPGVNTLDFIVNNGVPTGPTGLRVQFNQAIVVPEPGSVALLGVGGFALLISRRRKSVV